ncbi:unnamed protein product [Ixodes hexagonus]
MPQDDLMLSVKECILEHNDENRFRTKCGISVEEFLELLSVYLRSTFIGWQDKAFVQRSGVCIGSRVAPVLSNIFLGKIGSALEQKLKNTTRKIFRYVDNFLVFIYSSNFQNTLDEVLAVFSELGLGLRFTYETPKESRIQFLDILVELKEEHVCWSYHPRTAKSLLDYRSAHSKLIKKGIVFSCLKSALTKSCIHKMSTSFNSQIQRIRGSGFPDSVISSACDKIIKNVKSDELGRGEKKKVSVIPYIYRISHGLKKVASIYGVNVVFSARKKLRRLCSAVNLRKDKEENSDRNRCQVKHVKRFVTCVKGAVYLIPFSCGRSYIGQTGRCLNIRLREHHSSLKGTAYSHLAMHCRDCG